MFDKVADLIIYDFLILLRHSQFLPPHPSPVCVSLRRLLHSTFSKTLYAIYSYKIDSVQDLRIGVLNKRSNSSEKAFKNHNTSSLKCNMKKVGLFEVNYPVSRSIDD